ncbi:helix-turn-helix domain-containing protein [Flaviflexus huanghaiensis]|uniref:helix-turn-helix domain-containing protein n=1 Tax=Flaviflexus huanghaiensis TaxID=1111473 RepID=UPI0015F82985|nr:helix-turn-helix domain-containing protein [Flaviflexus huanghaiensis]
MTTIAMIEGRALYSISEAALMLGISERALREWHYAKRIKTVKLGRRVMVPATTIATIIDEGVADHD